MSEATPRSKVALSWAVVPSFSQKKTQWVNMTALLALPDAPRCPRLVGDDLDLAVMAGGRELPAHLAARVDQRDLVARALREAEHPELDVVGVVVIGAIFDRSEGDDRVLALVDGNVRVADRLPDPA